MVKAPLALAVALAALSLAADARAQGTLRAYHPRIFLSAAGQRGASPASMRARCDASATAYARACRVAAPLPAPPTFPMPRDPPLKLINLALRYLLYAEEATLSALRDEIYRVGSFVDRGDERGALLANATRVLHLAVVYDWLYDALLPGDRSALEAQIQSYADYNLMHEPTDVFSSEAYAHAAAIGIAGLALATPGDAPTAPARRYLAYADARWRTALLPALGYDRGWWPEGPQWFNAYAGRYALYYALAYTTATSEDLVAWARQNAGDPFGAMVPYQAYALRPDMTYPAFGDVLTETPAGVAGHRAVLDMLAWATGSTVAQSLASEVSLRLPVGQDYGGPEAWHQVVFYDPMRPAQPSRANLPLAAHLAPTASDVVVMRGSWDDESALHLTLACGDWFTRRQHLEAGSFQLYRRGELAVSTGSWDGYETAHWLNWYAQRSIHANTLAIVRPGETFPNARMIPSVNDGGQRAMPYAGRGRTSVADYRANLTAGEQFDTGGVTAFETSRFHDYAACDVTRAYNSTAVTAPGASPKVREVTRQVVLLRPELVVIFDRVEATDLNYDRRFLLHGLSRPVPERDGTFTLTRGAGRLLGRTLLPANATIRAVDGYAVDGTTVNPLVTVDNRRGVRLEVTAPRGREREWFLHVLYATDTEHETLPPASLVEEGDRAGVRIADPSGDRVYTVLFARNGPAGGDIRVQDAHDADLYRGALGAGGTFYAPVTDGGVAPRADAGGGGDAGADASMDAGHPSPTPPGCGCGAGSARTPRGLALLLLALAGGVRRRR